MQNAYEAGKLSSAGLHRNVPALLVQKKADEDLTEMHIDITGT